MKYGLPVALLLGSLGSIECLLRNGVLVPRTEETIETLNGSLTCPLQTNFKIPLKSLERVDELPLFMINFDEVFIDECDFQSEISNYSILVRQVKQKEQFAFFSRQRGLQLKFSSSLSLTF